MKYTSNEVCDHCDSFNESNPSDVPLTRLDYLRGSVCRSCDEALDEMLGESR